MNAPFHEFSTAHVAMLEVPPSVAPQYEHKLLDTISRIRAVGPEVAVIVQPSLRRRSDKSLWVHKWNYLRNAPFRFYRTCSCQLGNNVKGCHFAMYIGATWRLPFGPCAELPTLAATSAASLQSLGGTISAIAQTFPARQRSALRGETRHYQSTASDLPPTPLRGSAGCDPSRQSCSGSKQTPNSAVPFSPEGGPRADSRDQRDLRQQQTFNPTDAKVREKERRNRLKEQGIEHVVKKRKKIMEDHYDDCGDDLSSLQDKADLQHAGIVDINPCHYDTDDELHNEEINY